MKQRILATLLGSAAAAALGLSAPAQAQSAAAPAQTTNDTGNQDIVVTARKTAERLQTVPLAVTALTGANLQAQNVRSLVDLQNTVPNTVFQTGTSDPQSLLLSIRGQRQNDILLTLDPSIGVYVDGVYQPRTLGLKNALVDIDRVEVLRGPQGTLYGRNTTGGALSLVSNAPTDRFEGSLSASYGNYNAYQVTGILNVPLSDKVAARFVVEHDDHGPYGHDGLGRGLADQRGTYARGKLRVEFAPDVVALVTGTYQEGHSGGTILKIANINELSNPNGGIATSTIAAELHITPAAAASILRSYVGGDPYRTGGTYPSFADFKSYSGALDFTAGISDTLSLHSITGYQKLRRINQSDNDSTPFAISGVTRRTRDEYISQELQLLGHTGAFNWVTGVYAGHESGFEYASILSRPAINVNSPTINDSDVVNDTQAVFGQVVWSVLPRVRFTGGLRYSADQRKIITRNSLPAGCAVPAPGVTVRVVAGSPLTQCPREFRVENDGVSWLASLDYRPTDTIMMYGKIAHGYRAGGINLRGSNTIESFSPFNPESVTEYEAGLKIDAFRNLLRVNLAAYYDDYSNIQRSTTIATPNGNQTFVSNAASGTIKGVEAEVTFRPTPRLTLSGTGGLTDAKYRRFIDANLGDRSHETFGVPRWTASATGRYVLPTQFGRIALQSDYSYRSSFFLAPELPMPSQLFQRAYGLLDANVTVDITSLNLSLSAFGRNLTNVVHYESGLGLGPSSGYNYKITSDPRTYGVSAAYRF